MNNGENVYAFYEQYVDASMHLLKELFIHCIEIYLVWYGDLLVSKRCCACSIKIVHTQLVHSIFRSFVYTLLCRIPICLAK